MTYHYTEEEWYLSYLEGKTLAVFGYTSDGKHEAEKLLKNGVNVVIGLRIEDDEWDMAKRDGFSVKTLEDTVDEADIIQVW